MKNKFDAVEFQRKMRKKFSQEYVKNRKKFVAELKQKYPIRKKAA